MKIFILLAAIAVHFLLINKNQKQTMATLDQVKKAVEDLQATVDTTQAAIAQAISDLKAQIANGATPEQLQGVVDSLQAVSSDVSSTPTA